MGIVGDSLMVQSQAELVARIEPTYEVTAFAAENGLAVAQMHASIVQVVEGPAPPTVLLVALGANDALRGRSAGQVEQDVRSLLDAVLPHVGCVRWFDLKTSVGPWWGVQYSSRARSFNEVLQRVADDYASVETISLDRWAQLAGPAHFAADGLHFSDAGEAEVAHLSRQAVVGCDPARTSGPFWDVPDDHPFRGDIEWLTGAGVTDGYGNATYGTNLGTFPVPVSRAAMAAFMHRLAGEPVLVDPVSPTFGDVSPGHPFFREVEWLAAEGISRGTPASPKPLYKPASPVSRSAMAAFMHRLAGEPVLVDPVSPTFGDVSPVIRSSARSSGWRRRGSAGGRRRRPSRCTSRRAP